MSQFSVATEQLALAAPVIGAAADHAHAGQQDLATAAGNQPAFGSELIGGPFAEMCSRAQQAIGEIEQTAGSLAANVAAAGLGYLVTDQGIVPTRALHTFSGRQP